MGELPQLRRVAVQEIDALCKLNEPVEELARQQASVIVNDIKVCISTAPAPREARTCVPDLGRIL